MVHHTVGSIGVSVILGRIDDSQLDLVVKSQDIPVGITPDGGFGITIKEATRADNVIHWPTITIQNPERRREIYKAACNALDTAEKVQAKQIGFFTMGLEVARLPSWEIAEEIVKAINDYSRKESLLNKIMVVVSSPTQVSSFQYAITNIPIISEK